MRILTTHFVGEKEERVESRKRVGSVEEMRDVMSIMGSLID